ncbi:hypothetical protein JTB14_003848 [Gonioctena quinquepunctata]|nr:hypothetical protein JTB14_003848 [Gonioctena quinquepunctata]
MSQHCPCVNSLRNRSESGTTRVQTLNIQEKAVIPKSTDNRPFVIITIGESRFYALLDTGATRSFASEAVGNCCIHLGLEPSRQTGTQPRQADGTFCTITQAFSPQMTVGQESLVHELLILPHLTVDIILGMDILSNKFQIDLASNKVFLNGKDVSFKETQPLMYLHVPEGKVKPIPSESFTRNGQRDTTYLKIARPAAHRENRCRESRRRTRPGNRCQYHSISNLVLLKKEDVCVKADQPCMSSYKPAVIPKSVPSETFFKNETKDSSTYENEGTNEFLVTKLSSFQEKPGSARDMPRHIPLNSVSRMHSQSHETRMEDRTDLRHKLATQVKESTKMVNHSTQTFEDPFEKNGYFHWKEVDSQKVGVPMDCINEMTLDMLRPAAAKHLPVSLMPESIRRVRNIIPRPPQTTPPAVKDDCPRYLLVDKDLCWRCGHPGHRRQSCRKPWNIFCSRCGRCGVRSADCSCGQCPGSRNNKSPRRRGPRRMLLPPLLDLVVTGKVARNCSGY